MYLIINIGPTYRPKCTAVKRMGSLPPSLPGEAGEAREPSPSPLATTHSVHSFTAQTMEAA